MTPDEEKLVKENNLISELRYLAIHTTEATDCCSEALEHIRAAERNLARADHRLKEFSSDAAVEFKDAQMLAGLLQRRVLRAMEVTNIELHGAADRLKIFHGISQASIDAALDTDFHEE